MEREQTKARLIAEGRHVRLLERDGWEYAQRRSITGIVGIAAITDEKRILLVEQYRPPIEGNAVELPAGLAWSWAMRSVCRPSSSRVPN